MLNNKTILGVDVSDYETGEICMEMLKDVDLEKYPPQRVHFLVHALQMQAKLPSEASMIRTEIKN